MIRTHRSTAPSPTALVAALGLVAVLPGVADASGYYLLEADLRAGAVEGPLAEGGLGVALYADELTAVGTIGDAAETGGRRAKEWWIESRSLGPLMGTLPPAMQAAGFDEEVRAGRKNLWIPFRSWAFGSDYTTGRWLEWDASHHLLANLASLTRVSHRSLLFGPTIGVGLNLSWWEGWRGNDERLINTGKITAEAGWIAGVCLADTVYTQARLLTWIDAFGIHQRQLRFAGVAGFTGAELGVPLGLELHWELERGDDSVDTLPRAHHTVMVAATWRLMPKASTVDSQAVLDALRGLETSDDEQRSAPLDDEPEAGDASPDEPPERPPESDAAGPADEPGSAAPQPDPTPPAPPQGDESEGPAPQGPPL